MFLKKSQGRKRTPTVLHDVDGVIAEPKPKRAPRPVLSPEEEAARVALIAAREARKDAMARALEALSPALAMPGDPPVRDPGMIDISKAIVAPLLRLERLSGQGMAGSALVLVERHHDGGNGGDPQGTYLCAYAEFHDAQGFRARTRGVAFRRVELRAVAATLLALADRLDSSEREADSSPETLPERLA